MIVALLPVPGIAISVTSMNELLKLPYCKSVVLGPTTANNIGRLSLNKLLGNSLARYPTTAPFDVIFNTRSTIAASPAYNVSYLIATNRNDGGAVSDSVGFTATVDYWVEFSSPLPFFAS